MANMDPGLVSDATGTRPQWSPAAVPRNARFSRSLGGGLGRACCQHEGAAQYYFPLKKSSALREEYRNTPIYPIIVVSIFFFIIPI